jgi:hypothetical protein
MGLSAQQLAYLRTADQRFRVKIGLFPAYAPVITPPTITAVTGQALAPKPMAMVSPRHALVANGASITLYATDSYNRGGAYVGNGNVAWANTGGAGTLTDNGDGTASWTSPANGSGTNQITMTATNANGTSDAYVFLQYPDTTNDSVVAEIATISASVDQNGWQILFRVRGSASGFVVGAGILLHIEDTWNGTTSTFGGYKYPEGNFYGYITEAQYFEDGFGETWLGVQCNGPWWILERIKVGETWWGRTGASGRFYISTFAPVDAIWHFVTQITDFNKYHNCTLFYDNNGIADLIINESDLATIFKDVMGRSLATAWTDRYGSLMCIPDPDVRASEWWGTPSPVFDAAGAGALTQAYTRDYTITFLPYEERKLTMQALDSSKLGMWAISENTASSLGGVNVYPGKLICDSPTSLVSWCAQVRAKHNRKWVINVDRFLDHTVDLMNFVDTNFTSPSQANGPTASGLTWVNSINYRPDVWGGGWQGDWTLFKCTSGDVDGTSAWNGTGSFYSGVPGFTGDPPVSSWSSTAGGITSFCHIFDFVNSGAGGWVAVTAGFNQAAGQHVPGVGWSAKLVYETVGLRSAAMISISRSFPIRTITGWVMYYSGGPLADGDNVMLMIGTNNNAFIRPPDLATSFSSMSANWFPANETSFISYIEQVSANAAFPPGAGSVFLSARICGSGANPFVGS